ncbi:flagellar motor protein MotB [Psychrosphaera ytuae]|uniref:Flagellar motor protein MotB n=1 Tax=Psychrosphaera ytuae TaxID=2820710 RepID=A0A975HJ08_9GAMM|nr:flagellar motor protein MotB [Psychrosphaera ytuae]QTH64816.1 flagellar motor protein MotB [Psychrosphaera ytuae]
MAEEECPKCPPEGLPAWMGTFADLMSLLMCFFVLLLSFAEMDVLKFKQIAGSMKFAFGVQNKLEVKDIPKGTSVIAQEFRPGRPEPTPIEIIQQQTIEITQQVLEFEEGEDESAGGRQEQTAEMRGGMSSATADAESESSAESSSEQEEVNELLKKIAQQMEQEIIDGAIELESLGQQLIIRIRENGSFPSGSAYLQDQFKPIIRKVALVLNDVPGEITVSGHTDDINVTNELFTNNWDLSSQRAVAVATEMVKTPGFDKNRIIVVGHADTRPLVPNTTNANRRINRRVEVSIMQGKAKESERISISDQ